MPITNPDELETLSPSGEHLGELIHNHIKENIVIGETPCKVRTDSHEGFYRVSDNECWECAFRQEWGYEPLVALSTFLSPELRPTLFKQFIGHHGDTESVYDDFDGEVYFGKGCSRCGTNLRYEQCGGSLCVFCCGMDVARSEGPEAMRRWVEQANHALPSTGHWDRFLRDVAKADTTSTYEGKMCHHHKTTTRYTGHGRCVECVREANKGYHTSKKKPASDNAETGDFDSLFN